MTKTHLNRFREWERRMEALTYAETLSALDAAGHSPAGGVSLRNAYRTALAEEHFRLTHDPAMEEILQEMVQSHTLAEEQKRRAELYLRRRRILAGVPKDLYAAYHQARSEAEQAWQKCKPSSDYPAFEPYLNRLVSLQREMVLCRDTGESVYDTLLEDNEPGWNSRRYDSFFQQIRQRILPLIPPANQENPSSLLQGSFDVNVQRKLMGEILHYLGVTPDWAVMGESMHPLTTWIGEQDVRFTTKYRPNNAVDGILSTIHESGHAWYVHNVDPAFDGSILMSDISAAMHESQSRLCENHLGRSAAFWRVHFPALQAAFPHAFSKASPEQFLSALNTAHPSLIRTEADELTYPIHILIRYELEQALFDGDLRTKDLEEAWNRLYGQYLGLEVTDAAHGVLQDMHWAYGYFGYFPTYALGSAYAAQFAHAMSCQIPVDALLEQKHYAAIMDWLREHVHRCGALYNGDEMLRRATGEDFRPEYYFSYLEQKYRGK